MRAHTAGHLALASSLVVALVVAACGGGGETGAPQVPQVPAPSASAIPSGSIAPEGTAPTPSGSASVSAPAPAPVPVEPMKEIGPSAFIEDLTKLGIDPQKPPALNKLSPDVVRKLMPSFSKSLGVKCDFCHDTNNFKAWTRHKHVASKMWSELVVQLQLKDGSPVYCDSCHGGKAEFLDRRDMKALGAWMHANYVDEVTRADKKEQTCAQCHGEPFKGAFLEAWSR